MAIINEIINKIYQPETELGWTEAYLSTFGFRFFSNNVIKKNYRKALEILNKNLPYFYYYSGVEQLSPNGAFIFQKIYKIIIDDDIYDKITIVSTKGSNYTFSKNIFEYANFIPETIQVLKKSKFNQQNLLEKEQQKQYEKIYENFINIQLQSNQVLAENQHGGIYGIYSVTPDGEQSLQYIGLTCRPALDRQREHADIIKDLNIPIPDGMEKLYILLRNKRECGNQFIMKILISFDDLKTNKELTLEDKESMELALIEIFKPVGNTSGVDIPYRFSCVT